MRRTLPLLVLLALGTAACGYRLAGYAGSGAARPRIAFETLRNDSFEPGLEFLVNDALQREFLRRGAVQIVEDPEGADLVVGGAVLPVTASSRSFSSVEFALEYELTLRLELSVMRPDGEEMNVDSRALRESELYLASADVEVNRKNRTEALRRMATVIAARVHDVLVETARW